MRCVLGIDSGGTKCDALVATADGEAIGWGHCDFRSPHSGRGASGSGRSVKSVKYAVAQAIAGVSCEELHVTSQGEIVPLGLWRDCEIERVILRPMAEYESAFALVGESCGIVALSGTGSFVHGKSREGRRVHLDGLGPLVGDRGSGYQIGRRAIRAAVRSLWHPRHRTDLVERIPRFVGAGAHGGRGAAVYHEFISGDRDRAEVAALADVVSTCADEGDTVARGILEESAADLAETVRDAVETLDMRDDDYAMVGTGGVILNCDIFWDALCRRALEFAPHLRPTRLQVPAVAGVVLSTLIELDGGREDFLRESIVRTTREIVVRSRDE
jgi:N-acetylglucosamine kinase-like BadF-type ATPase